MARGIEQVEIDDEDIKVIVDILKFAQENCPIESAAEQTEITGNRVKQLIAKLQDALKAR